MEDEFKTKIREQINNMQTKEDLLRVLNRIKAYLLDSNEYPFELRQLNYYCNPIKIDSRYRYFTFFIPKKNKKEVRAISAPTRGLKSILTSLNFMLQTVYTPSKNAFGFVPGKSVVDNARLHVGKNYVYNIDLKDFFPSINKSRIRARLMVKPFSFNEQLASMIAGLCCMKNPDDQVDGKYEYILPQGAPTSPLLTNAICDRLDHKLRKLSQKYNVTYSRYADDMTFSSDYNAFHEKGKFLLALRDIIRSQGFVINKNKIRLQKRGCRQEVTGLTVCEKVNVERKYVKEIRNILYIWKQHGFSIAEKCFLNHYKLEKANTKKGNVNMEAVIGGKLDYMKMVKGPKDPTYLKLYYSFQRLLESMNKGFQFAEDGIRYLKTKQIADFEKSMGVDVIFKKNKLGIENAFFEQEKRRILVHVSEQARSLEKGNLYISLCEKGGQRFYLIHKNMNRALAISLKKEMSLNRNEAEENINSADILKKLCDSNFDLSIL